MENIELYHWGVRGMRWGVRRYQNKDGTLTAAGKKRYNAEMEKLKERERIVKNHQRTKAKMDAMEAKRKEVEEAEMLMGGKKDKADAKKTKTPAEKPVKEKKKLKDMTNDELQATISRMQLEKTYRDLAKKSVASAKPNSKSKEFVVDVLEKSGKNIATQLGAYVIGTAVNKVFERVYDDPRIVDPKNIQKKK